MDSERTEDVTWNTLSDVLRVSVQEREKFKDLTLSTKKTSSQNRSQLMSRTLTEIGNLEHTVRRIDDSIEDQSIKKIENPSDEKSINKFIIKLEKTKEETKLKIQDLHNSYMNLENDSLWIDWIKDYQEKMKDLDSLDREERNLEITKYVQKVDVTFDEDKRTHKLKLRLELPLIGDNLEYKNKNKKSEGYKITQGSYEKETSL